jgi:predicted Ser/Thr protein kinase
MNTYAGHPEPTGSPLLPSEGPHEPFPEPLPPGQAGFTPTPVQGTSAGEAITTPEVDSTSPPCLPNRCVGKYKILEQVQAGGMGIVYKAHDTDLKRTVALKMIKAGTLATDAEIIRFHREAEAAAQLNHPNIIPVYEVGQHEGCLYFTMPFAWGGSLAEHQPRFLTEPRAAVELVEKVTRAVHYAHRCGILHRDLKPANILLDERGTPWVSDFGLAKFLDASLVLTQPNQTLGTPAYMAPEQARGQTDQTSAATDVWALGVVLFELLTCKRPFQGATRDEQLRRIQTTEPLPPRSASGSIDRPLETVILKCLEKDPARRYASAEALADDLRRWLRGEPVTARPLSWPVRTGRIVRRYRSGVIRLLLTAAMLTLLGLAWRGLWSSPKEEPEDAKQWQAMEEQLRHVKKGETVTLIGGTGAPVGARWQPPRPGLQTMLGMDQIFQVAAGKEPGLLELLAGAPKRYRLRARVQHCDNLDAFSQVGIYFCHGQRRLADGTTIHCFFRMTFNDRIAMPKVPGQVPPAEPANRVDLTLAICKDTGKTVSQGTFHCTPGLGLTPAGMLRSMPWRSLVVEVTPERIKTFWGGKEVDDCDVKTAIERAFRNRAGLVAQLGNEKATNPPLAGAELAMGEGIGLYVERGVAAFQSVVIEPLPK